MTKHRFAFTPFTRHCLLAAALVMGGGGVWAQRAAAAGAGGVAWASLSGPQRTALAPLQADWQTIEPARQQKWLEVAARFPKMPVEERERMQQRMAEWTRLTPRERGQARVNFQETRQVSPEEREARWQSYQALPADQKKQLAERAAPTRSDREQRKPAPVTNVDGGKSNIVRAPASSQLAKPVAPTVMQAGPGATTTLMSRQPKPPLHQQPGLPKIAATPEFVDSTTLLPQRGAQGAATRSAASASAAAPRK
jgi:hypothetical protein